MDCAYGPYCKLNPIKNGVYILVEGKKEEIRLSPMTKTPTPTEKSKKQRGNTKRHHKHRLHSDCGPTKDGRLR